MTPALTGALAVVVDIGLLAYASVIVFRGLLAWLGVDSRHRLARATAEVTDPVLRRLRALLPSALRDFPLDVSYLVAIGVTLFARYAMLAALAGASWH